MKRLLLALGLFAGTVHAQTMPPLQFAELGTCKLDSGSAIEQCRLGYRAFGALNAGKTNAVLFPVWFAGRSGDVGALIGAGPNFLLDTTKYLVIVVDPFGNGVSSSPSNSKAQRATAFPVFTIRDMVRAEERLVGETLHLTHIHAVVGQSMGGMQAFEWAVDAPGVMDEVVSIVGTPQLSSADLLLWSLEKEALEQDPAYMHGAYVREPALPLVAAIHQMNLSSPAFRAHHTTREQFPAFFAHTGADFHAGSDANDYLRQVEAMLAQDIAHGGDIFAVARAIQARMLVINASEDHMVNPIPPLNFAKLIHAQTLVLTSDCGHMAPGCEMDKVVPVVAQFLER